MSHINNEQILQAYLDKVKVADIVQKYNISVSYLYKYIVKPYHKQPNLQRPSKRITDRQERNKQILHEYLNGETSIQNIHKKHNVSIGYIYNIVKEYTEQNNIPATRRKRPYNRMYTYWTAPSIVVRNGLVYANCIDIPHDKQQPVTYEEYIKRTNLPLTKV